MHKSKVTTKQGEGQSDSDHRQRLQERMSEVGYVPGTPSVNVTFSHCAARDT